MSLVDHHHDQILDLIESLLETLQGLLGLILISKHSVYLAELLVKLVDGDEFFVHFLLDSLDSREDLISQGTKTSSQVLLINVTGCASASSQFHHLIVKIVEKTFKF
jgi:hypothetical protein